MLRSAVICADRPGNSWATGTNASAQSQLIRIREIADHCHPVTAENLATSANVTMADFATQAADAVEAHATFVTVELGENDLCEDTPLERFDSEVRAGLQVLTHGEPDAKVLLLSIEDLGRHWRARRNAPSSAVGGTCRWIALGVAAGERHRTSSESRTRSRTRLDIRKHQQRTAKEVELMNDLTTSAGLADALARTRPGDLHDSPTEPERIS